MYRRLHVLISKTEEQAMSQYRTFTAQDAVGMPGSLADLTIRHPGRGAGSGRRQPQSGFKIFDSAGVSRIVVKQALPYVRCVGESGR